VRDQPFYSPNAKPPPPRQPRTGELLFEFLRGHDGFRCELRDHGETCGVEAVFFQNDELLIGRRFDPRLDSSRPSRELAIQWAGEERKAIEKDGA
jgi:hypothetical protein